MEGVRKAKVDTKSRAFARDVEYTFTRVASDLTDHVRRLQELIDELDADGDTGHHTQEMRDMVGALNLVRSRCSYLSGSWYGYAKARAK